MRFLKSIASLLAIVAAFTTQAAGTAEDVKQLRGLLQPISVCRLNLSNILVMPMVLNYRYLKVCLRYLSPINCAG